MTRAEWGQVLSLVNRIQAALSLDLLTSEWRDEVTQQRCSRDINYLAGHCYVASEAFYHLWGKKHGFKPYHCFVEDRMEVVGHWYLRSRDIVLDITREQFGQEAEYTERKRCAFLTKKPSKRARELMRRVQR